MRNKILTMVLIVLILVTLAVAISLIISQDTPSTPSGISPSSTRLPKSSTPTSLTVDIPASEMPSAEVTVTRFSTNEPTLPPAAQAMQAAPTATPGTPLPPPSPTPTVTPFPTLEPIPVTGIDDVTMVEVQAGEFIMGTTLEDANNRSWVWQEHHPQGPILSFYNETPQLTVYLDTFFIDELEVTNARYRHCVQAGICSEPQDVYGLPSGYHDDSIYDDYPVQGAQWADAYAYCQWVGKRLPTEAEWEKAARGTDGRLYPWGNEYDPDKGIAKEIPQPVGSYSEGASPYGAMDMLGNATEWTLDWYQPYPDNIVHSKELRKDYQEPYKVTRGDWSSYYVPVVSYRSFQYLSNAAGFRCVSGPVSPPSLDSAVVSTTAPHPLTPTTTVDLSKMVYVPAGEFIMGTNVVTDTFPEEHEDEKPQHIVYLNAFYIDRFPVTYAQYLEFLDALGSHIGACNGQTCVDVHNQNEGEPLGADFSHIKFRDGEYFISKGYESHAVDLVSWEGAQAYCAWRGKRLPTEAQWEKAARGTDGRRYPWGDGWDERSQEDDIFFHHEVGYESFNVSPYGVHDMLGHGGEWVNDWYAVDYYSYSPLNDPKGPESGEERVTRGGNGLPAIWGITSRSPGYYSYGFRCVYLVGSDQ